MKENKLIVADSGWADEIPEWILNEIRAERMINGMCEVIKKGSEKVGDAEVVAYLFTANLRHPISSEMQKIYLKLSGDLMKKRGIEIPDFMNVGALTEWENRCLDDLRHKIKCARGKLNHPLFDILKELKRGK